MILNLLPAWIENKLDCIELFMAGKTSYKHVPFFNVYTKFVLAFPTQSRDEFEHLAYPYVVQLLVAPSFL